VKFVGTHSVIALLVDCRLVLANHLLIVAEADVAIDGLVKHSDSVGSQVQ
jgi:hypothetical protein